MKFKLEDLTKEQLIVEVKIRDNLIKKYSKHIIILEGLLEIVKFINREEV